VLSVYVKGMSERNNANLSMANAAVPIRRTVRDRLSSMRKNTSGLRIPYRTAKKMEGAKSTERGVPPIGVGNLELIVGRMGIGASNSIGRSIYRR
jgi:hypothetical protein